MHCYSNLYLWEKNLRYLFCTAAGTLIPHLILYPAPVQLQVNSYPWSASTPSHTLSCSSTAAGTLIPLISLCTFSYSILLLHCCRHTHTLGQPLHLLILLSCTAAGTLIPLVSHCTFSYSILLLHYCKSTHTLGQPLHLLILNPVLLQVHSYPWSATAPSHTLSCSCTAAGTPIPLVSLYTFSYSILHLDATIQLFFRHLPLSRLPTKPLSLPHSSQMTR